MKFRWQNSQSEFAILVVTYDTIARVDLRISGQRQSQAVAVQRIGRPSHDDLSSATAKAFRLGAKAPRNIILLTDECWSGTVALEREIFEAIEQADLPQTLALELEERSGIPPFESSVACVPTAGMDARPTWRVAQIETSQQIAIESSLPKRARQSVGIAAPVLQIGIDGDDLPTPELKSDEDARELAAGWLDAYLSLDGQIPILRSEKAAPVTADSHLRVGLAAAALLLCALMHFWSSRCLVDYHAQLKRSKAEQHSLQQQLQGVAKQEQSLQATVSERSAHLEVATRNLAEFKVANRKRIICRNRPTQLLKAIADSASPSHWIRSLRLGPETASIRGLSLDNASVATLAQRLEAELRSDLWAVMPPAFNPSPNAQLVQFEIVVRFVTPDDAERTADRKGRRHVR